MIPGLEFAWRYVKFEWPIMLLLIPVFSVLAYLFSRMRKRYERGSLASDLQFWIKPMRGKSRAFFLKASLTGWVDATMVGLSFPSLFLAASTLPLFNVGIIWVIDASLSMASEEDVFGLGGRFGAAQREIMAEFAPLVNERIRPRMGVVIFSGSTRRSLILYDDYGRFLQHVSSATIFPANDQGTNYEAALTDALNLCTGVKDLVYCGAVLVTDGDRESKTPQLFSKVLPLFAEKKVRLDVVGVGKNEAPLPQVGELGSPSYFNDRGELVPITTKYDAKFLREMADATGGIFYEYGERGMLRKHVRAIRQAMEDEVRQRTKRWMDVSEYCFMAATVFLLMHLVLLVPYHRIFIRINYRRS